MFPEDPQPGIFNPEDPQPGIYLNLPFKDYCNIVAINASHLKKYKDTPAHTQLPDKDSKEKNFGRAFHPMLLEGDKAFFAENVILPDLGDQRNAENKQNAIIFGAKHDLKKFRKDKKIGWIHDGDLNLVSYADYGNLKQMKKALYGHPGSADQLKDVYTEVTLIWIDPTTGLLCKGRIDILSKTPEPRLHTDLKSAKSSSPYIFRNDVKNFGYYISMSFYQYGWHILTEETEIISSFISVEKLTPYWTALYTMEPEFIDAGMNRIHKWLAKEVECRKNDHWPHYNNEGADSLFCPQYLQGDSE